MNCRTNCNLPCIAKSWHSQTDCQKGVSCAYVPSCSNFGARWKTSLPPFTPILITAEQKQSLLTRIWLCTWKILQNENLNGFASHKIHNFAHKTNEFELFIIQLGLKTRFQDIQTFFIYKSNSKSRGLRTFINSESLIKLLLLSHPLAFSVASQRTCSSANLYSMLYL